MSTQFQQIRSIFLGALERPMDEWSSYLEEAAAGDAGLQEQVRILLDAHAEGTGLLDRAVQNQSPTIDQPITEKPGTQIGPYKLLQQLGEGGMGVVYMAEQKEPVKRRVALKIIKPGMDTRQVIARFEAERQALAMMDHPNIAKVLDAGATESGRPYFVMELVNGLPVTEYCDEQHLTPKERLELFVPICQAVQHAHQKGIIHRDLKPSNILVALYDGRPVPKVIDFGVAKATSQTLTEKTMFTQLGQIVGTLEYMSPEQAERNQLDIDTRSDIYSLGVVLYELLTGDTPFDRTRLRSAAFDEMLRIIREEEPPRPSTRLSESKDSLPSVSARRHTEPAKLTKLVRGELDWIVMKAMDKDRARRYETASKFAEDVHHYLNDRPVVACPPSAAYRFRKSVHRHRTAVTVSTLISGLLLLFVGSVGWMVRDRSAREQQIEQERATRQTLIGERVVLALEEARERHREGRLREALNAAKRAEALAAAGQADAVTHQPARDILRDMQMLVNLEDVRDRSTRNVAGYDLSEQDRGMARCFREYGIDIDALDRDDAARRIRARSVGYELAAFLDNWSFTRRRLERQGSKPVGKDWKELLEVARAADPDRWRDRFRKTLLNDDSKTLIDLAASTQFSSLSAETVDRLGSALLVMGSIQEAADFLKKGQQLHPQHLWININLGICLKRLGQSEEAARYWTAAVALRPEAASTHNALGSVLMLSGKLDEAIACFRKAVEIDPKDVNVYVNLGNALRDQDKLDEAIACWREGINIVPGDNRSLANLYRLLGDGLRARDDAAQAIDAYSEAVELSPDGSGPYNNLGLVLVAENRTVEAIVAFQKAVVFHERRRSENPNDETVKRNLVASMINLAKSRLASGDLKAHQEACQRLVGLFPPPEKRRVADWGSLGRYLFRAGQYTGACTALQKVIELRGEQEPALTGGPRWWYLAMSLARTGERERAHEIYEQLAKLMEQADPPSAAMQELQAETAEVLGIEMNDD